MKVLFIGGTGNISTEVSKLCIEQGVELYLLNRGNKGVSIKGCKEIIADFSDKNEYNDVLHNHHWDVVVNWIVFNRNDIESDISIFAGKTNNIFL